MKNKGHWPKGVSGNPAGRGVHSRKMLADAFVRDLRREWESRGEKVLKELQPVELARLVASMLPKDFQLDINVQSFAEALREFDNAYSKGKEHRIIDVESESDEVCH